MPNEFNERIIEEFRANQGRVGGWFEGARLLLLTTTGRRSGVPRTSPVGCLPDGGGQVVVIASAGGADRHPDWYHNLVAEPRVTVEDGVFTYEAEAEVLTGEDRDRMFARAVEADDGWAEYQRKTDRVIPVVVLRAVEDAHRLNAESFAEGMKVVHDGFRRELAMIREEITSSGAGIGGQLRMNCLTVCQGLRNHHLGEDTMLFPQLTPGRPELAPVMDRLAREHEEIAELAESLRLLVSATETEPGYLLQEFDRLAAELEAHLRYEEEQLIPVMAAAGI
ncbi:nitroreductase/quinone reductase family protein [Streptomyces uncialis]|uniref:nitroreductase/quinone reductase family protein n=1 Tax=Streptomyces uncialis TaxID=1048205 RepID=UPI002E327A38|nr:nitroreductase/quinone reductase family protein [Streptomyces uncialis]